MEGHAGFRLGAKRAGKRDWLVFAEISDQIEASGQLYVSLFIWFVLCAYTFKKDPTPKAGCQDLTITGIDRAREEHWVRAAIRLAHNRLINLFGLRRFLPGIGT